MGWYKEYLRDLAEIKAAEDKKQGMWIGGVICGIIGLVCFIVAASSWHNSGYLPAVFFGAIWLLMVFLTFICFAKAEGGCTGLVFCLFIAGCDVVCVTNSLDKVTSQKEEIHQTEKQNSITPDSEKPIPKTFNYLNRVNDINNSDELSQFYFDIAGKFHNNKMGLKGSQEQINAGNELMSVVYVFLARSAKKETDLNVDNIRTAIQSMSNVSDFRKKKALEELQLGIDKIKSINNEVEQNQATKKIDEQVNQLEDSQEIILKKAMKEIVPAMKSYAKKIDAYKAKCPSGCDEYPYWNVIGFKSPKSAFFEFKDGTEMGGFDWQLGMEAKEDVLGITCHWIIRCVNSDKCECNISEDCKNISPNLKSICEVEYDEY